MAACARLLCAVHAPERDPRSGAYGHSRLGSPAACQFMIMTLSGTAPPVRVNAPPKLPSTSAFSAAFG